MLITGGTGQLGTELSKLLEERHIEHISAGSNEINIVDKEAVDEYIQKLKPKVIYHCAAYTAVDAAEEVGKEANYQVNAIGTKNVATAAEQVGATVVYISTDYVFDGLHTEEYKEDDFTNPKNEYGKAKLAGELQIKENVSRYYIVRTSWVFGQYGKNFVYTMLKLANTHNKLTVVSDQFGRPTWTRTLAEFITHLIDTKSAFGIYHLSNDHSCSWYEFAKEILIDKDIEILPVTSNEYPQKAYRPKHSIMNLDKAKATGFEIVTWEEALKQFLLLEDKQSKSRL